MKVTESVGCWRNLETLNLWVENFCQKLTFVGTLLPSTQGWKVGHHVGLFVSRPHRKPVVMFFFLGQKTVSTLQLVFTDALKNEKPFKLFATETLLLNKDLAASLYNFPIRSHFLVQSNSSMRISVCVFPTHEWIRKECGSDLAVPEPRLSGTAPAHPLKTLAL